MSALSAHEFTRTRFCKVAGCENEVRGAFVSRGPYAGICEEHYDAQRARMSAIARGGGDPGLNGSGPVAAPPLRKEVWANPSDPSSFEGRAKALVSLGRKVDLAFVRAERAKGRCQPALNAARKAKEEADDLAMDFKAAARALVEAS